MIRGLLSGDYWIFVGCCSAAFVLFFLGIRAGISAGNWNLPVLVLVISLPTLPGTDTYTGENESPFFAQGQCISISFSGLLGDGRQQPAVKSAISGISLSI